jgi:hypothetical protein
MGGSDSSLTENTILALGWGAEKKEENFILDS